MDGKEKKRKKERGKRKRIWGTARGDFKKKKIKIRGWCVPNGVCVCAFGDISDMQRGHSMASLTGAWKSSEMVEVSFLVLFLFIFPKPKPDQTLIR